MKDPTLQVVMGHPATQLIIVIIGFVGTVVALSPEQRLWTLGISLVVFILSAFTF